MNTVTADELDKFLLIAKSGAPELAISLIDEGQDALELGSQEWIHLEKTRLTILEVSRRWEEALKRISSYPGEIEPELRLDVYTLKARALLELNEPAPARRLLRRLLSWKGGPPPRDGADKWNRRWRHLIIESYLSQRQLGDAATTLLQYIQDYGSENPEILLLQARTMVAAEAPEAVESVLRDQEGAEVEALRLLSSLETKSQSVIDIIEKAEGWAESEEFKQDDRRRFWIIASRAAAMAGKHVVSVGYLEHALAQDYTHESHAPLFEANADTLWTAYLDTGRALVSEMQLTEGDEAAWLEAALTYDEKEPIKARAIYGVLALQGSNPRYRDVAHLRLADSLSSQRYGDVVVNALYTRSDRFKNLGEIPDAVRARLSDYNLARDEVNMAKKLLQGIEQPPEGYDGLKWQLLLSRVAILSGREKIASKLLKELLDSLDETMDRGQAEPIIRVLLDLQRVGKAEACIGLFDALLPLLSDPQQIRELWYWQAEAYRMMNRPKIAASLYMRSAGFTDELLTDPWGQYARFYAAEALSAAGLIDDSRRIYEQLLRNTEASGRRAVILHKLQLLPLKKQSGLDG